MLGKRKTDAGITKQPTQSDG